MKSPLFVVPVADLDRGEVERTWPLTPEFLSASLQGSDATPRGTPGRLHVSLGKNGREVVIRGHLEAELTMPCARTLDPVNIDVACPVFLLLSPPPAAPKASGAPRGKRAGKKGGNWTEDPILTLEDAATDTYDGENVVLDSFVREFLLLELPLFPLRSDLHSTPQPAIESPPQASAAGEPERIDPRLAPLAAIASRLRDQEKKE